MNKKRNKIMKLMTTAALVLVMCVSMVLPSLAEVDKIDFSESVDGKDAKAAITKSLKMPIDTTNPEATFEFVFTADGILDRENVDKSQMPLIPNVEIEFVSNDKDAKTFADDEKKDDFIQVVKEVEIKFTGISQLDWAKYGEGVYVYYLTENQAGFGTDVEIDLENEEALKYGVYSKAKYYFEFWVQKNDDNEYFVEYILAKTVKNFVDEYYPGQEGGVKVNPTPGGYNTKEYEDIIDDFSGVIFTNGYWKTDGDGPIEGDAETALEVTKIITGNGANKNESFEFNIIANVSSVVVDKATHLYNAKVISTKSGFESNIKVGGTDAVIDSDGYFKFKSGQTITLNLSDGVKLIFVDLPVGTDIDVVETGKGTGWPIDYRATYVRTFSDMELHKAGEPNIDWGFSKNSNDTGSHRLEEGPSKNSVTFTNKAEGEIPTGISVDNLPYIVMIGLAIAGLIGFAVIKSRRNAGFDA